MTDFGINKALLEFSFTKGIDNFSKGEVIKSF